MIMLLLSLALCAAVLTVGGGLFAAGMRSGDRSGETMISGVQLRPDENVCFTVENPGSQAVVIGASVRRSSLRLRCEGGRFVSVPRVTTSDDLLAGRHAAIYAIPAGEQRRVLTPVPSGLGRRGELVVTIGEQERLRVVHRAVELGDRRGRTGASGPTALVADANADAIPLQS
jgi:hypothetical protein